MTNVLPSISKALVVLLLGGQPGLAQVMATTKAMPKLSLQGAVPQGIPLREVLSQFKTRYGVDILFEDRLVSDHLVTGSLIEPNAPLERNLTNVLRTQGLRFRRVKAGVYMVLPSPKGRKLTTDDSQPALPTPAEPRTTPLEGSDSRPTTAPTAADRPVTGRVTDGNGNNGLPGVSVVLKGTGRGTTTDSEGNFRLLIPDDATNATLVFSFIGYATHEEVVGSRTVINTAISSDNKTLSEVVVVGYGTQKKSDLTGSVASVKATELTALPQTNITQALQGRAAGVQVTQNSGAPGGAINVRIRGSNSILGGNNPLYVVDGFALAGTPSALNPADIESVEILKDASATAIYGSRGANGVVLVTTRRGKTGKGQVDIDSYYALQTPINYIPMLNARQFAEIANQRATNDGQPLPFSATDLAGFGQGTDWQRALYRQAPMQNHVVTFSGGTDKLRYSASANYLNQQGIVRSSGLWRGGLRANLSHKVSDKLTLDYSLVLTRSNLDQVSGENSARGNGVLSSILVSPPTIAPLAVNGNYSNVVPYSFSPNVLRNALALAQEVSNVSVRDYILANVGLNYEILTGLTLRSTIGVESDKNAGTFYSSRRLVDLTPQGSASQSYNSQLSVLNENTLTYNRTFAQQHAITALGGVTYQTLTNQGFSASATGFANDVLQYYSLQAGSVPGIPSSSYFDWTLLSYLGRVNYSYAGRYLLTASLRADGSSRFSDRNKWGYFPSAALGWRIIEEPFMKNVRWLSDLKLRGSIGETGNTGLAPYQTLNQLSAYQTVFGNALAVGYAPGGNLANPDLKWETTRQTDVGIDLGFWQNRVQVSLDYYRKVTRDLLASVPMPPGSGYVTTTRNIGSIENQGVELSVSANVLRKAVRWDVAGNVSSNRNNVLSLANGSDVFGITSATPLGVPVNIIRVGQPMGAFFGFQENGLDANGAIRFVDQNGDGVINDNDRVVLGNPNPRFTFGFNSTLTYKGFELTVFLQGVQGNQIFNLNLAQYANSFNFGENQIADLYNNYWTPDNPNARYPKISVNTRFRASNRYVEDGSYLRVKNVQLAYNLPTSKLGVQWLRSAQLYVSGQNVLTFTRYSWYDPEVSILGGDTSPGVDLSSYPNTRLTTFGVRIGL